MKNIKTKLNDIFLPLIQKRDAFVEFLKSKNLKHRSLFCNGHFVKENGKYFKEIYPIPVVEVKDIGDFVFDLDVISFEGYFLKTDLLNMNLKGILKKFNNQDLCFYGETDYLTDLFYKTDDLQSLLEKLKTCKDKKIAINFTIADIKTDFKNLINLIKIK